MFLRKIFNNSHIFFFLLCLILFYRSVKKGFIFWLILVTKKKKKKKKIQDDCPPKQSDVLKGENKFTEEQIQFIIHQVKEKMQEEQSKQFIEKDSINKDKQGCRNEGEDCEPSKEKQGDVPKDGVENTEKGNFLFSN